MDLDDPFPIHLFPKTARESILEEFSGRHPSVREVISITDQDWLSAPGFGPILLARMRRIALQHGADNECVAEHWTNAELQTKFQHIADQHEHIQRELAELRPELSMIAAVLRRRGISL